MSSVAVAAEPSILTMRLVPFGAPQLVADFVEGRAVIYYEEWDAHSFGPTPERLPLLRSHDNTRPIGWLEHMKLKSDGLDGEARLVGSSAEIANTRELIRADLLSNVSIGFAPNSVEDLWMRGGRRDRPPTVKRRGARLREVSLVLEAALTGARVSEVRSYTVAEAERREQHRQRDEEFRQYKLERRAEADAYRINLAQFLEDAETRGRAFAGTMRTTAPAPAPTATMRRVPHDDDIVGVTHRAGPGHYLTWADATPDQRARYLATGTIVPRYD
jgi:HK97 family phage prohead protease